MAAIAGNASVASYSQAGPRQIVAKRRLPSKGDGAWRSTCWPAVTSYRRLSVAPSVALTPGATAAGPADVDLKFHQPLELATWKFNH